MTYFERMMLNTISMWYFASLKFSPNRFICRTIQYHSTCRRFGRVSMEIHGREDEWNGRRITKELEKPTRKTQKNENPETCVRSQEVPEFLQFSAAMLIHVAPY